MKQKSEADLDLSKTKLINQSPPRCKQCWFPDQDDPKRFMVSFINPENGKLAFAIKCPNILTQFGKGCSSTWEPETTEEINLKNGS